MHGITINTHIFFGNIKGRDHLEDLCIDERIIFELILNKYGTRVWAGFFWLRIGTSDQFL
jgi:hypothetical protein